jgi:branched-chain amino acid transport system substrate-binding protein
MKYALLRPGRSFLCGAVMGLVALSGAAQAESTDPIKIGAVTTLTGPMNWPESSAAARAVFDRVNAQGGINGRKIEYIVEDDKFDPTVAGPAAHRLVDEEKVVANVAGSSVIECAVNAQFYNSRNFLSIQGTGIDQACFTSPSISPVNTGPAMGTAVSLYYASEQLKKDKICMFVPGIPSAKPSFDLAVSTFEKITGKKVLIDDRTMQPSDDLTQFVLKAQRAECEAVVFAANEPQYIAWMRAVKAQKATFTNLFLTSAYTDNVASVLGADGEGAYANSEFEPYLSDSPVLADWKALMKEAGVPPSSFSEGGYLAATIMVDVLKSIKGEINRESVTKALRELTSYPTPLSGDPYSFGPGKAHQPNKSSKFVQIHDGKWVVVTPDFVRLPEAK